MTARQPFNPRYGSNQVLTPAAGSAAAVVDSQRSSMNIRLVNNGSNICYVRTYDSRNGAQSATVADFPVPPNMASTLTKSLDHDTVAHISAAGTTLQVMLGEGW